MQADGKLDFLSPAVTYLTNRHPHLGFFAWARIRSLVATDDPAIPVAATDGYRLLVNPAGMRPMTLRQQVFVLAHEVTHVMMEHPWMIATYRRRGDIGGLPYDDEVAQPSMDLIINDMLVRSKVGEMPPNGCYDPRLGGFDDDLPTVYARLWKEKEKQQRQGSSGVTGKPTPKAGPGSPVQAPPSGATRAPAQLGHDRARSLANAKARGTLPGCMDRMLEDVEADDRVDFREVLPRFVEGSTGRDRKSFKRPSRRMLALHRTVWPGWVGTDAGTIVIQCDSSGSIGKPQLHLFMGVAVSCLRQMRPREVILLDVDACVQRVRRYQGHEVDAMLDDVLRDGVKGRGGTDMPAGFSWCRDNDVVPDGHVILTDGLTPWGEDPGWAVFWAITLDRPKAPWGMQAHVPVED